MSQNDMVLANAAGATFRADVNSALQALVSRNSGASSPSTTYAYMPWADTTLSVLKMRNAGDTAWLIVESLDTDRVISKTGAYTLQVRDVNKLVRLDTTSGAFTLSLPAAAADLKGFVAHIEAVGTGGNDATLDPDASETINGVATLALADGQRCVLTCDGTAWHAFVTSPATSGTPLPPGHLNGLALSNNGSDAEHDIDIATGKARDFADSLNLSLSSVLTKRIDADWAEGNNGGGFPTALTLAANTWYRVFAIGKTDGTTDAGFDTSATAANLLSDASTYSKYRRMGWVQTDGSSNIFGFIQDGDDFWWTDPGAMANDEDGTAISATESTYTMENCPPSTKGRIQALISGTSETEAAWFYATDITSAAATTSPVSGTSLSGNVTQRITAGAAISLNQPAAEFELRVDSSQQIHGVAIGGSRTCELKTMGWTDRRGRDD